MADALAVPTRRVVTPVIALMFAIALLAAVALGFALRAWTDNSSSPAKPTVVVQHDGSTSQDICRMGRPC